MLANLQGCTWAHSSAAARLLRIFVEKRVAKFPRERNPRAEPKHPVPRNTNHGEHATAQ